MELTTHLNHSEWGRISRNGDNEEWELSESYLWPKIGMIEIRFYIMDPDSSIVQKNYNAIKNQWKSIWSRIISRTEALIADYGHDLEDIDLEEDYFYLRLPEESIDTSAGWSVMLQGDVGWLLDFEGWIDSGEQGVF